MIAIWTPAPFPAQSIYKKLHIRKTFRTDVFNIHGTSTNLLSFGMENLPLGMRVFSIMI